MGIRLFQVVACVLATMWGISPVLAQVMQSTNYRIEQDSVNVGGGFSTSTSYTLESTAGEVSTGYSSSTNYAVHAGYQQSGSAYLALTGAQNVVMSPSLGGVTGGTSNGSTTVTVTTDNGAGYQLTIAASSSPAMRSASSVTIPDYAPAGANPDFTFAVSSSQARFGFSPEGVDIGARFKDNGSACNTGSGDTSLSCWDGLSTSDAIISTRGSSNQPSGTDTTIKFRVGIGSSVIQEEGTYIATTTLTAIAL